jgi:hypothetical protein
MHPPLPKPRKAEQQIGMDQVQFMRSKPWGRRWPRFSDRPGPRRRGPIVTGTDFTSANQAQPHARLGAIAITVEELETAVGTSAPDVPGASTADQRSAALAARSTISPEVTHAEPISTLQLSAGWTRQRGMMLALPRKSA